MAGYGDKPFGMRQIVVVNAGGTAYATLPAAQTLKFGERVVSEELPGNDQVNAVVSIADAVEWELEHGGISLEAYALLTGRTATESGTTPTRSYTLAARAGAAFPYVQIRGKAIGEGIDDIHVKLPKAKITGNIEGEFSQGKFFVTKCKGIAIDNGSNMWEWVQHETAATLPTT
jgi:hypothetical protein